MDLTLQRAPITADGKSLPGMLSTAGLPDCCSLENAALKIPAGRYAVTVTVSERAENGELWTPDPEKRLPLLMYVPGRTAIRLHAANEYSQLEGCIAVGKTWTGAWLGSSQVTFKPLFTLILAAFDKQEPIWITVTDAPPMLRETT